MPFYSSNVEWWNSAVISKTTILLRSKNMSMSLENLTIWKSNGTFCYKVWLIIVIFPPCWILCVLLEQIISLTLGLSYVTLSLENLAVWKRNGMFCYKVWLNIVIFPPCWILCVLLEQMISFYFECWGAKGSSHPAVAYIHWPPVVLKYIVCMY